MNIISDIPTLQALIKSWRSSPSQARVALVPTMGNLHAGHLALVQKAKTVADHVIVSIFVNPLQFGPHEDFQRYPRTLKADVAQLTSQGVDAIFAPKTLPSSLTRVVVPGLSHELCGATRPQLFEGVTTIVSKLFNLIQPDIAVFGEKDFQQCVIIRQMVHDLNFPVEIITSPIVRATNGLALSSRNRYLTRTERKIVPKLYAILCEMREKIKLGEENYGELCANATQQLLCSGFTKIDYVSVREATQLKMPDIGDKNLVILAAAFLGRTRLIDNVMLEKS
jgi:pantoate--beta-alanine ligase